MDGKWKQECKSALALIVVFLLIYWLPLEWERFTESIIEALALARWYAREHVLLCLVPAFFIAGAIGVFIGQNTVMKYFGARAKKWISYSVASVSGTILAVCSCTVLPLFGGIYMRGAGLGPAIAFLYSGPAINVLAVVLTARVLGWELGVARAVGAIIFSVFIGLAMHFIFLKEERAKSDQNQDIVLEENEEGRPLWQVGLYFFSMIGILVFANWGKPEDPTGIWYALYNTKWMLTGGFAVLLGICLWRFFSLTFIQIAMAALPALFVAIAFPGYPPEVAFTVGVLGLTVLTFLGNNELREWRNQSWGFAKQILPLLLIGVLAAGFFLGTPESADGGIIPNVWIEALVGDSPTNLMHLLNGAGSETPGWLSTIWPIWTNFFASITGALMYFATLTEVPILRGLLDSGMGQGPALALLLAGPALSLPNMLVINSVLGPKKTLTFVGLVAVSATIAGLIFGTITAS